MSLELSTKQLFAFLNGICKNIFSQDATITAQFLKDNVFPELDVDISVVENVMNEYADIFKHATAQAWGAAELVQYLATKGVDKEEMAAVWAKIWKNEEAKAHNHLIDQCTWNNKLQNVAWRIDLLSNKAQTATSDTDVSPELSTEAIALINMHTSNVAGGNSSVLLELNKHDLKSLLTQMDAIQTAVDKRLQ